MFVPMRLKKTLYTTGFLLIGIKKYISKFISPFINLIYIIYYLFY